MRLGADVGDDTFEGAAAPSAHDWAGVDVVPDGTHRLLEGPRPSSLPFRGDVDGALNRLARARTEPMAWAGAEFAKYAPEERVMLEALIGAITLHRTGELSDDELYTIWAASMSTPRTATAPSPRTR